MSNLVPALHKLADDLGRPSGRYIPAVVLVETAIREINRLRKVETSNSRKDSKA